MNFILIIFKHIFSNFSFITYRSCRHLDGKHTIFGKLVGGLDTLTEIEKIEVDNKDRPIEDIILQRAQVFTDPFAEVEEELAKERSEEIEKKRQEIVEQEKIKEQKKIGPLKAFRQGVGKYLNIPPEVKTGSSKNMVSFTDEPVKKRKKEIKQGLSDFSSW